MLVPPMVYLEKLYIGETSQSFWPFYAGYFFSGIYPAGNLSWHHFWFVAYLYLFCVFGWTLLSRLRSAHGHAVVTGWIARYCLNSYGIYLFVLPLLVFEIVLRPMFPGFRDLIHDWASFSHWFLIFIAGFVFAGHRILLDTACRLRMISLLGGILTSGLLFTQFWVSETRHLHPFADNQIDVLRFLWFCVLRMTNAGFWILCCVGFAARYLNRPSQVLSYLNQAVYPVFCLHLTVLVGLEYLILPLDWSVTEKYLLITSLAVVLLLIMYQLIRPFKTLGYLLGIKPHSPERHSVSFLSSPKPSSNDRRLL